MHEKFIINNMLSYSLLEVENLERVFLLSEDWISTTLHGIISMNPLNWFGGMSSIHALLGVRMEVILYPDRNLY